MKVREIVRRLLDDGWQEIARKGSSHRQFVHPTKPGKVTVPDHPGDVKPGTLHSIWKQAGLK
jgi:predicted RNA binding protein YcfA (HicA-like mRNA interferase family)